MTGPDVHAAVESRAHVSYIMTGPDAHAAVESRAHTYMLV